MVDHRDGAYEVARSNLFWAAAGLLLFVVGLERLVAGNGDAPAVFAVAAVIAGLAAMIAAALGVRAARRRRPRS